MRPVLAAVVMLTPKVNAVWLTATPRQPKTAIRRRSLGVGLPPGSRMRSRHSIRRPPAVKRMPTIKSGGTNSAAYLVAAKLSPKKTAARISEISVISAALLLLSVMAPKSTAEAQRSPARGPSWSQFSPLTAVNGREPASRSEEHTSELQSRQYLVCRLLLEKKKKTT